MSRITKKREAEESAPWSPLVGMPDGSANKPLYAYDRFVPDLWTSNWTPAQPSGLTFVDFFCGAGGSSIGMTAAGFELLLGINHWFRAIETHGANFRLADHKCMDLNGYDMRRLPRSVDVLWASVICTEGSPAGGTQKVRGNDPSMADRFDVDEDDIDDAGWERTRVTGWDVVRATELWRFKAIVVENVFEFVTDWPLFPLWLRAFKLLGYKYKIVSANSAHLCNDDPHYRSAPQWRDRIYVVFVRKDFKMPTFAPRPLAYCFDCGTNVRARQTWKKTKVTKTYGNIGKYGPSGQYVYTCPNTSRPHTNPVVEPWVRPAISVIRWENLGPKIGERRDLGLPDLAPNTLAKITRGMQMMREGPTIFQVSHGDHEGRHYLAAENAFSTRTQKGGDGLTALDATFLVQVGGNKRAEQPVSQPMPTRMTRDTDAIACCIEPYVVELHGGGSTTRPASHPFCTLVAGGNHAYLATPSDHLHWNDGHRLVIPYRKRSKPKNSQQPLPTLSTKDSAALATPAIDINDVRYRMVSSDENLEAQNFPHIYQVTGGSTERTAQAGNAVSTNAAYWIGQHLRATLER
ncbi:DNA cytosine methyltransferase [Nonomuraea sp. SYSU D8015]|uniref:DNA cytosine methyltransferase n=1 Tax=Nonomuraea sp. SYSU D8015 TaxID=2593644 RepID=UPI00166110FD|nr:DNA cytosine methyltransferase [Nonomuraea sp. SYSU D8015]